jgi:hypothetical protein
MRIAYKSGIATGLCIGCFGLVGLAPAEAIRTLQEIQKGLVADNQSRKGQASQVGDPSTLGPIQPVDSTPTRCPAPIALDMFKHEVAYQRTEQLDPLRNIRELRANVWQRGPLTAFYIRHQLDGFAANARMTYLYGKDGLQGGGTCPAEENWRECVGGFARLEYVTDIVGTCSISLDMSAIPTWKPSANDAVKRRVVHELRGEIESKWPGVQKIVLRDFNLKDNQITMYLRMPDGDYYQGCGFNTMTAPHCTGWHLFGNAQRSSIRKWIFEQPYPIK